VRLTVLGCAGSHPGPGRACSSYLLEADGYRLLLDCGNGSMTNLLRVCAPRDVDAVVLSHRHHDHWADLVGLYVALRFDPAGAASVPVYGPAGLGDFIGQILPGDDTFAQVCPFSTVAAGDRLELGPFALAFFAAHHPPETLAVRVTHGSRVVAYSADSAPSEELVAAARDADLFIADCTFLAAGGPYDDGIHMTAEQAGQQATAAGVRRLLVTHVWPGNDPADAAAEAATTFAGETLVARDCLELDV
jgi:ribonuclease BN (tRNA processing enzyme)